MKALLDALAGLSTREILWYCWGGLGQSLFACRFFVQWVCSERRRRSHVPISFWYLSLVGSVMMLVYTVHLRDPILILGFSFGLMVYSRNLILIWRHEGSAEPEKRGHD